MIKKTMTPEAIAANRVNAERSTGPKTENGKEIASQNATKHGILSNHIQFRDAPEEVAYTSLMADLNASIDPTDPLQKLLAEELATASIRQGRAFGLEAKFSFRHNPATEVALKTASNSEVLKNGCFLLNPESGWDCTELMVLGRKDAEQFVQQSAGSASTGNGQQVQLHAKFQDPAAKVARYVNATGRDFYRALGALYDLRAGLDERRKSKTQPTAKSKPSPNR
jgi:hypothetical protein